MIVRPDFRPYFVLISFLSSFRQFIPPRASIVVRLGRIDRRRWRYESAAGQPFPPPWIAICLIRRKGFFTTRREGTSSKPRIRGKRGGPKNDVEEFLGEKLCITSGRRKSGFCRPLLFADSCAPYMATRWITFPPWRKKHQFPQSYANALGTG